MDFHFQKFFHIGIFASLRVLFLLLLYLKYLPTMFDRGYVFTLLQSTDILKDYISLQVRNEKLLFYLLFL